MDVHKKKKENGVPGNRQLLKSAVIHCMNSFVVKKTLCMS